MPESSWKHLSLSSEEEFKSLLLNLYIDKELSQALIAKELGIHITTVENWFRRFGIQGLRNQSEATHIGHQRNKKHVVLSNEEFLILDGLLLGDGHIDLEKGGLSARYTHGEKHRETLLSIQNALPSLAFSPPKLYNGYWFFKSKSYAQLVPVWQRWYGSGRNTVPDDISLFRSVCYWWFIGDGSIFPNSHRYDLQLCLDGFSDKCRETIRCRFTEIDIKVGVTSQGRILVSAKDVPKFYELIGSCQNPEYLYKWDYVAPKWTFYRRRKEL